MVLLVGVISYGLSIVLYVTSTQNIGATMGQILFSTAPKRGFFLFYFFEDSFHLTHMFSIGVLILAVIVINLITHEHHHIYNDGHHYPTHDTGMIVTDNGHSHLHTHKTITHTHHHYPDLHLRHRYN